VICQETPHLSLHQPHSLSCPPFADDGVPVAVGLVLIVGGDLEREGFVMLERGTAVKADTRNAGNREFDRQHIARLAGWVVTGERMYCKTLAAPRKRNCRIQACGTWRAPRRCPLPAFSCVEGGARPDHPIIGS